MPFLEASVWFLTNTRSPSTQDTPSMVCSPERAIFAVVAALQGTLTAADELTPSRLSVVAPAIRNSVGIPQLCVVTQSQATARGLHRHALEILSIFFSWTPQTPRRRLVMLALVTEFRRYR